MLRKYCSTILVFKPFLRYKAGNGFWELKGKLLIARLLGNKKISNRPVRFGAFSCPFYPTCNPSFLPWCGRLGGGLPSMLPGREPPWRISLSAREMSTSEEPPAFGGGRGADGPTSLGKAISLFPRQKKSLLDSLSLTSLRHETPLTTNLWQALLIIWRVDPSSSSPYPSPTINS